MSGKVTGRVLDAAWPRRAGGVTGSTLRLVAIGLADRSDGDGANAHPGLRQLARRTGLHTDTISRALVVLQDLGVIYCAKPGTKRRAAEWAFDLEALARLSECAEFRALDEPECAEFRAQSADLDRALSADLDRAPTSLPPCTSAAEFATIGLNGVALVRAALSSSAPSEPALKGNELTRQRGKRRFARYQGADHAVIVVPRATGKQQAV